MPNEVFSAQKILNIVLTVIGASLMGFFVWLATAISDIQIRTARIEENVKTLNDTRKAMLDDARTSVRVDELAKAVDEQKDDR